MKSKKKRDQIEITSHGELYEEMHREIRCFICPECGSDNIRTDTNNRNITEFFDIFEFQERVTSCTCRDCKCKFELYDNKKLLNTDWYTISAIVALISFGLVMLFGIIYLVTDSDIIGGLTLFSSLITIISLIVGGINKSVGGN